MPLSERQQMALLKRIEEHRQKATSPKPDNPQVVKKIGKNNKINLENF